MYHGLPGLPLGSTVHIIGHHIFHYICNRGSVGTVLIQREILAYTRERGGLEHENRDEGIYET